MKLSPADLAYLITADLLICGLRTRSSRTGSRE
ncbi:hypothetical protein OHA71_44020 [Streptomyces sp. NBC_00444]